MPPEARRFLDSLNQLPSPNPVAPPPTLTLVEDEEALRQALGVSASPDLGSGTLERDEDGSLWVLINTPAGKIPLRPVGFSGGQLVDCKMRDGSVDRTYLISGAPAAMAVQFRRTMTVIALGTNGKCIDLQGEMPTDPAPSTFLSVAWAPSAPPGIQARFTGVLLAGEGDRQRLDFSRDRVEVFLGDRSVARSDALYWPQLLGRPPVEAHFFRLDGGGFAMRLATEPRRARRPLPSPDFARQATEEIERDHALFWVLPDGRLLPSYMTTEQPWRRGQRDVFLCGGQPVPRCADIVTQEHTFDETDSSYYFYRTGGVLRWTLHETARHKTSRDGAKTCMVSSNESAHQVQWHVRSWSDTRWHPLSSSNHKTQSKDVRQAHRCDIF